MLTRTIEYFRRAVLLHDGAGLSDSELLGRFVELRDAAALTALVQRHSPMVLGAAFNRQR